MQKMHTHTHTHTRTHTHSHTHTQTHTQTSTQTSTQNPTHTQTHTDTHTHTHRHTHTHTHTHTQIQCSTPTTPHRSGHSFCLLSNRTRHFHATVHKSTSRTFLSELGRRVQEQGHTGTGTYRKRNTQRHRGTGTYRKWDIQEEEHRGTKAHRKRTTEEQGPQEEEHRGTGTQERGHTGLAFLAKHKTGTGDMSMRRHLELTVKHAELTDYAERTAESRPVEVKSVSALVRKRCYCMSAEKERTGVFNKDWVQETRVAGTDGGYRRRVQTAGIDGGYRWRVQTAGTDGGYRRGYRRRVQTAGTDGGYRRWHPGGFHISFSPLSLFHFCFFALNILSN